MAKVKARRFVTRKEMKVERLPWGPHDWLSRPDIVEAEQLLLVRVHMPRGKAHKFHVHPTMEEIIYVLEGKAEQWVDREKRILGPGDIAHIPKNVVHGTYNAGRGVLRFLAILGPAKFKGPALIDKSNDEPWRSLRNGTGRFSRDGGVFRRTPTRKGRAKLRSSRPRKSART